MSFTPGPWSVRQEADPSLPLAVMAGDLYVATPHMNLPGSVDANARLIAAAPELLARLREVVSLFADPCPYDSATTLAAARAAIAKAEGQP